MAKSANKRFTIYPDAKTLAVLSIDTDDMAAPQIHASLDAWADVVERAAATIPLDRAEWNYLADVLNGCLDLWIETQVSPRMLLLAEAEDAHRLNRTGDKWFGDDAGKPTKGMKRVDDRVGEFLAKLRNLDDAQTWAVLCAVRHFWRNHESVDHVEDDWWTVPFRRGDADKPIMRSKSRQP